MLGSKFHCQNEQKKFSQYKVHVIGKLLIVVFTGNITMQKQSMEYGINCVKDEWNTSSMSLATI